jgi:hypothetical protein
MLGNTARQEWRALVVSHEEGGLGETKSIGCGQIGYIHVLFKLKRSVGRTNADPNSLRYALPSASSKRTKRSPCCRVIFSVSAHLVSTAIYRDTGP